MRSTEIYQEQLHGEKVYADVQRQSLHNDHVLILYCTAALNPRDRILEVATTTESFTKALQSPKKDLMDFL